MPKNAKHILQLVREQTRRQSVSQFCSFVKFIFPNYQLEWFHRAIANHCQMLIEGTITKLMVFIPPQHGKSQIISKAFPAWALGRNPDLRIAGCSYSADLAKQFSRSIQRIIDSPEYHSVFPATYLNGSNIRTSVRGYIRNVDMFECVGKSGFYKAVGVGGGLTGTPVDIAIIDDPVKDASEAYSPIFRERVWNWYNSVLTTRLHNDSKQLFIMTRWHDDDLAGRLLKTEGDKWTVLSLPAICEQHHDGGLSDRQVGEALWPERHSLAKLLAQKSRAAREFSALYQQSPRIDGGNIIKDEWLRRISRADFYALRFREPIHFFLDTAYDERRKGADNDPSGIIGACRIRNNIYITCAKKVWKSFPDLIKFLPDYLSANGYDARESTLRVEPKANGKSVVQQLEAFTDINVTHTPTPTEGKEVRLHGIAPRVECGRVYIVEDDWTADFVDEVCGFPSRAHDEYVDLLVYAVNYFMTDDYEAPEDVASMFAL